MKTTKHIVILLALALLTSVPAQSKDKPAEELTETRIASCLVKITADPAVLPLNIETVDYLLHSSGVGGKAAREVLGVSPDKVHDLFTIEYEELLGADDLGGVGIPWGVGVGIPWNDYREGLSGLPKTSGLGEAMEDYETMMYDEMMKTEQPGVEQTPSSGSSSRGRSSSVGRSTSRTGTGTPSTRRSTTATRSRTTTSTGTGTSTSYSPRRSRDRGTSYDYYYSRTAAASPRRTRTTTVQTAPAAEQTYLFSLRVDLPVEVKPAAEEFMQILVYFLQESLSDAFKIHKDKLESQLNLAAEEANRAEADLRNMQETLREISGSRILDRNSILRDISILRDEIQSTKMDQAADQVSIKATTERIAEIQRKLQAQIAKDVVTRELQRILEIQSQDLENTKKLFDAGTVSSAELAGAEEKIARAKIELAQRRELMSKSAGGDLIESLNKALADRSILTPQYKAQLSNLEEQFAEALDLLGKTDDYELLSLKADIARQNLQEAIIWRDRMNRRIRMLPPPTVSVIGGE